MKPRLVAIAGGSAEALWAWQEHRDEIDLVLTDMVMPEGISGMELAQRLRAHFGPSLSLPRLWT